MSQYTNTSEYQATGNAPAGSFRFNTDTRKLEIYNGESWWDVDATSTELETGGTRGVWAGGEEPSRSNRISFMNVDTHGNITDFGDATRTLTSHKALSSRTKGLIIGGFDGPQPTQYHNAIDFVTIASTGNGQDYGDLAVFTGGQRAACSNSTRGIVMGGMFQGIHNNTIEFMTIAQNGNSLDFGDLTTINVGASGVSNQTRGLCFFGNTTPARSNSIEFVTIATTGNSQDFGDSTSVGNHRGTAANGVRGVTAGGITPSLISTIQYVTIANLGNAIDFGDLTAARAGMGGGCASSTRGVFGGGYTPSITDIMDSVQIMSAGNATDFGNLATSVQYAAGFSNGHGGLH